VVKTREDWIQFTFHDAFLTLHFQVLKETELNVYLTVEVSKDFNAMMSDLSLYTFFSLSTFFAIWKKYYTVNLYRKKGVIHICFYIFFLSYTQNLRPSVTYKNKSLYSIPEIALNHLVLTTYHCSIIEHNCTTTVINIMSKTYQTVKIDTKY